MAGYQSTYRVQLSGAFVRGRPGGGALPVRPGRLAPVRLADPAGQERLDHGYDVVDPTRVAPELGGEAGLRELVAALGPAAWAWSSTWSPTTWPPRPRTPGGSRPPARPGRRAARVFDIDWEAGGGKVRLPVLGGPWTRSPTRSGWATAGRLPRAPLPAGPGTSRLEQQHYELVEWRRAAVDLNYRRFFTVNDLIGVRQEDPEVYRLTHATILRLVAEGLVDGVRRPHRRPGRPGRLPGAAGRRGAVRGRREDPGGRRAPARLAGRRHHRLRVPGRGRRGPGRPGRRRRLRRGLPRAHRRRPRPGRPALAAKRERLERDLGAEVAGVARHLPGDQAPTGRGGRAGRPPRPSTGPT